MNADKDAVTNMLEQILDLIEGLDGNEDALEKAMEHIVQARGLIQQYAIED